MDYAQQQRTPGRHMVGFGIVLALHVLLGWALVNGLAQRMIEVIKAPIETKIIEEVKPPEPPPPENLPPPPPAPRVAARPAISNVQECAPKGIDYPAAALRAEAVGTTKVRFTIGPDSKLVGAEVVKSAGPSREHKMLDRLAVAKLSECSFKAGTDEGGKPVGASFDVEYVWKIE